MDIECVIRVPFKGKVSLSVCLSSTCNLSFIFNFHESFGSKKGDILVKN